MDENIIIKSIAEPKIETKESIWLDMATGEIVREWGNTVSRYRPGDVEFSLYAQNNLYVKRNDSKSGA